MVGALTLYLVYCILVLGLWLYWRRCRYWAHKFKDIYTVPSVAFPIIGHMHEFLTAKSKNTMMTLMGLGRRAGALDTLKPTVLWAGEIPVCGIFHPEDIEVLLGSTKEIFKPDPVYKAIKPFFGDGLISLNGATWQHHRKVLTPTFHFKILERYVDVFRKHAEVFVQELRAPKYRGVEVDAMPCTTRVVSETICETAFGMNQRLSQRDELKKRHAFFDALDVSFKSVRERLIRPWLQVDALYHLTSMYREQTQAEAVIREYSRRIINMKREEIALDEQEEEETCEEDDVGAKKKVAFLDLVLRDGKNVFTEEEILNEVRTLVTVQQTTASTLAFIFVMLAIHQDVQEKVYEEIWDLDHHSMSSSYYDKLGEMKYLERVIKETMRLYPVTIVFARELLEELAMPSVKMPPGVICFVCPFVTHRGKQLYGPDPERFDPDHFLPERCRERHPYAYIPFSAGSRNCIGQKYAMLQMKAIVSTVIRHIRIFPGKGCHSQEELVLDTDTFLHIVGGFNVRFEPREVRQSA